MIFNVFSTERIFRVAQYDGINDFVAFDLGSEKRALVEFFDGEFHPSAMCVHFDPLVAHSAPQIAIQSKSYAPQDSGCVKLLRMALWHDGDGP